MRWPPKMQGKPAFHDKSKFCEFHNDHDHYMMNCKQLKVEIAQLLRQGHLKEFISEQWKAVVNKRKKEDTLPPETLWIVNTISKGSDISSLTVSTTSSYIYRVNSVTPEYEASDPEYVHSLIFFNHEVRRLRLPHDDSFVISLNVLLRRMLVNTGSSANIIFLTTLKEMGIKNTKMENMQISLVGFSGEQVSIVGTICLSIYVKGMNLMVRFIMLIILWYTMQS